MRPYGMSDLRFMQYASAKVVPFENFRAATKAVSLEFGTV